MMFKLIYDMKVNRRLKEYIVDPQLYIFILKCFCNIYKNRFLFQKGNPSKFQNHRNYGRNIMSLKLYKV